MNSHLTDILLPEGLTNVEFRGLARYVNLVSVPPKSLPDFDDESFPKNEALVFTVVKDSAIEKYCVEHQLAFQYAP